MRLPATVPVQAFSSSKNPGLGLSQPVEGMVWWNSATLPEAVPKMYAGARFLARWPSLIQLAS